MDLHTYFANAKGTGVLATAATTGTVTTAVYAKPHVENSDTVVFLMRERLTYEYLRTNGHAGYLFLEQGEGFKGVRLMLEKIDESDDEQLIAAMSRRHLSPEQDRAKGPRHLVRFKVVNILPLVGDGPVA
jgi:hypothetical protein